LPRLPRRAEGGWIGSTTQRTEAAMIPIISYCYHGLEVDRDAQRIRDLAPRIHSSEAPFAVHDARSGASALVIPAIVDELLDANFVTPDTDMEEPGVLDALRADQLIVGEEERAVDIGERVEATRAGAVLAVDSNGVPRGLMIPSAVLRHWATRGPEMSALQDHQAVGERLAELGRHGQLVAGMRLIEETLDDFHSEGINLATPSIYLCSDHGRSHPVSDCPCDRHPGTSCKDVALR